VAFFYRSIFVLVVAAITWFSYVKHIEGRDRTTRVQDLRDCFERRDFSPGQPSKAVQTGFLQAVARLHEAQMAERSLGWWKTKDISLNWYIDEGLKELEASQEESSLIGRALQNAYFELQRQDALALSESREKLKTGTIPQATEGLFAGEALVIGYQLSPVVLPQLRNHPGNFVIQPATVWALQQDLIETSALSAVREFVTAGVLPESAYTTLRNQLIPPTPASTAQKND
jgi:hypothetical protein